MAGQTNQERDVLFFDRLTSLQFVRSNGVINHRGGEEGGVKIRIHQGSRGAYIACHFGSLNELLSNVRRVVEAVSADGLTVSIFLIDSANGRRQYQRLFHLSFFDEMAALAFFKTYTSALPNAVALKATTFEDLQQRQIDEENAVVVGLAREAHHHDDWDTDDHEEGGGEYGVGEGVGIGEGDGEGGEDEAGEEANNILDDFDDFGESQDLYNPLRPAKFN